MRLFFLVLVAVLCCLTTMGFTEDEFTSREREAMALMRSTYDNYMKTEDSIEALKQYQMIRETYPDTFSSFLASLSMGGIYYSWADTTKALECYQWVVSNSPEISDSQSRYNEYHTASHREKAMSGCYLEAIGYMVAIYYELEDYRSTRYLSQEMVDRDIDRKSASILLRKVDYLFLDEYLRNNPLKEEFVSRYTGGSFKPWASESPIYPEHYNFRAPMYIVGKLMIYLIDNKYDH